MQLTHLSPLVLVVISFLPLTLTLATPTCIVPLPLFFSLPYSFTLQVQNSTHPSIHNHHVNFIPQGTPGDYRTVISPLGTPHNLNLTDFHLTFAGAGFTAYLRAPIKTVYRQVSFVNSPGDALEVMAKYGCDDRGRQQVEVTPYVNEGKGLGFCVAKNFFTGEMGLYVKPREENVPACVEVKIAVKRTK
ncbi:hypothetical protein K440DRAFT_658270 [Wilcoxina mikolae CBS 423.85]|nr:hypothetical protein K440DRAFT_658270 [Wilcoxina mikolae CBS 423.85]